MMSDKNDQDSRPESGDAAEVERDAVAADRDTAAADRQTSAAGGESSKPAAELSSEHDGRKAPATDANPGPNNAGGGSTFIGYAGFLIVIAGSIGWIARSDKPMYANDATDSAEGSASDAKQDEGPCAEWRQRLCDGAGGDQSIACSKAKHAADLLSPAACKQQLSEVPETLARIEASRADCTALVTRLCTDLGTDSEKCQLVQLRTPAFPADRCSELLGKYDDVLAELQGLDPAKAKQGMQRAQSSTHGGH